MTKQLPHIAYIVEKFPSLTQTFVYREVQALREHGLQIRPFSIWPSDSQNLSNEAVSLVEETTYIFPISWYSFFLIHLRYFFSRPLRYLRTLLFMISQPEEPIRNRWRSIRHFGYGLPAIREMERLNIQHIHAHSGWSASSIALIANRLLGISFSLTLHAHGIFIDRLLLKAKMRYCRFLVTISEYNRQYLNGLFTDYNADSKIHVIHCGINPDIFTPPIAITDDENEFSIVGIGQLDPRKGFHILVEACRILVEKSTSFKCFILGEGQERNRLEILIDKYKLHGNVFLTGRITQEDLRRFLAKADISVLPCIWDESGDLDGIPVALMETMAMGIPSVSTKISGIPELINHEQNGLLANPGDPVELADAIMRLKNDPDLRRKYGQAGRETIINNFNIHNSVDQMKSLFKQIKAK